MLTSYDLFISSNIFNLSKEENVNSCHLYYVHSVVESRVETMTMTPHSAH